MNAPILWLALISLLTIAILPSAVNIPILWIVGLQLASLYGFIGVNILLHRRLTAVARAAPISRNPADWCIDHTGLTITGADFQSHVGWRSIVMVLEEADRFVFAMTPNSNFLLPFRVLSSEQIVAVRNIVADMGSRGVLGAGVD